MLFQKSSGIEREGTVRNRVLVLGAGLLLGMVALPVSAQNLIFGNSAGSNTIHVINRDTGVQVRQCSPNKGNGRGIVVVGNIGYFTVADSANIFKLDINTCADLGVAFTVAGVTGLSTIAYDGTNFWVGDYSGPNRAFLYSPTGVLLSTVTLENCTSYCDGLEYFNNKLISNRGDPTGPYDIYDINGNLLTANFIGAGSGHAGIAYDGTNFYVSSIFSSQIEVYNGVTGELINTLNLTGGSFLIEDLSTDYAQRPDTGGGPAVPVLTLGETALILLILALTSIGAFRLRKRV